MNQHSPIFAQIMKLVPRYEFNLCVQRYAKDINPKKFSFWDQFLAMAFAQLTYRESLRDIEICLSGFGAKTYHMGFRSRVTRSTLAYANDTRDWHIWHDLAQLFIPRARQLYAKEKVQFEFEQAVYALDSSTISLCFSLFAWAKFRSTKRGIKLHTQLDLRGNIPTFILISQAKMNDVSFIDLIIIEAGALYVMDRGYFDFERLYRFTIEGAFFVTRIKTNIAYRRVEIFFRANSGAIRLDAAIVPLSKQSRKKYPQRLRLIEYYDLDSKKLLVFITNNFSLSAQTIADIYKARWQVELFFKWIKQHLRIKTFFGTSENAVKTQIWIAITVYLLVAIIKKELKLPNSMHSMFQLLSLSSTLKTPILSAFYDDSQQILTSPHPNQLNLFDFPIGQ